MKLFQSLTIFTTTAFLFAACKARHGQLQSLSKEELAACGQFNGSRYLFTMNPEPDFDQDLTYANKLFLKQMSGTNLFTQYSYFTDEQGNISKPCAFYVETEQAKYDLAVPNLYYHKSTKEEFSNSMAALGRKITNRRKEISFAQPELANKHQIQLILTFSSHGNSVETRKHPEGGLVVHKSQQNIIPITPSKNRAVKGGDDNIDLEKFDFLAFSELVQIINDHLLTPCVAGNASCQDNPLLRKADEIIILVDACYSGLFLNSLKTHLSRTAGYDQPLSDQTHATKILAATSSTTNQVSVGSYSYSGRGALSELFGLALNYWLPDENEDNIVTFPEMRNFLTNKYQPSLINITNKKLSSMLAAIIKGKKSGYSTSNDTARVLFLKELKLEKSRYQKLYSDPVNALSRDSFFDDHISLQQPTFFTNVADSVFDNMIFSVRGKSPFQTYGISKQEIEEGYEDAAAHLKNLVFLLERIGNYIESKNPPFSKKITKESLDLGEKSFIYDFVVFNNDVGGATYDDDDDDDDDDHYGGEEAEDSDETDQESDQNTQEISPITSNSVAIAQDTVMQEPTAEESNAVDVVVNLEVTKVVVPKDLVGTPNLSNLVYANNQLISEEAILDGNNNYHCLISTDDINKSSPSFVSAGEYTSVDAALIKSSTYKYVHIQIYTPNEVNILCAIPLDTSDELKYINEKIVNGVMHFQ